MKTTYKRAFPSKPHSPSNRSSGVSDIYSMGKKKKPKSNGKKVSSQKKVKLAGYGKKPDREASRKYALKGGNPALLKKLREAVEQGQLTKEEALNQLRGIEPTEVAEREELSPPTPSNEERLKDIRARKAEQHTERKNSIVVDGFLYLITNPAYQGWVKVGQTSDYEARLSTYQTSSPHADYCMAAVKYVDDRRGSEAKFLTLARQVFEVKGEWISASLEDLIDTFDKL